MYHPTILSQYLYRRCDMYNTAVDACCDTASFYDLRADNLAQFLRSIGIDADRLSIL
jgi:hypothetical protein